MKRTRIVIAGAAGRDFHNFNVVYRGRDDVQVVAFTATQIPNIHGRVYPAELAGEGYPDGIPILPEGDLAELVRARGRSGIRAPLPARHDAHVVEAVRRNLRRPHRLRQEPDDSTHR